MSSPKKGLKKGADLPLEAVLSVRAGPARGRVLSTRTPRSPVCPASPLRSEGLCAPRGRVSPDACGLLRPGTAGFCTDAAGKRSGLGFGLFVARRTHGGKRPRVGTRTSPNSFQVGRPRTHRLSEFARCCPCWPLAPFAHTWEEETTVCLIRVLQGNTVQFRASAHPQRKTEICATVPNT